MPTVPTCVAYSHEAYRGAVGSMRPCCDFISGFSPGKDFLFSRELLSLAADFQRWPTAREQLSGLDAVSHALAANIYFLFFFFKEILAYGGPYVFFILCIAVVWLSLLFCWWPSSDVGDLAGRNAEEGLGVFRGRGQGTHPTRLLNHTQGLGILGGF